MISVHVAIGWFTQNRRDRPMACKTYDVFTQDSMDGTNGFTKQDTARLYKVIASRYA